MEIMTISRIENTLTDEGIIFLWCDKYSRIPACQNHWETQASKMIYLYLQGAHNTGYVIWYVSSRTLKGVWLLIKTNFNTRRRGGGGRKKRRKGGGRENKRRKENEKKRIVRFYKFLWARHRHRLQLLWTQKTVLSFINLFHW